jgi:pheromone shutdown protein TraB
VCDPTVSVWTRGNRIIYLLGTAHISEGSAQLAGQLVRDVVPEGVFVELDIKRVGGLGPGGPKPGASSVSDKMNFETSSTSTTTTVLSNGDGNENDASVPQSILVIPTITAALPSVSSDLTVPVVPAVRPEPKGLAAKALNFGAQGVGNAIKGMYKNLDQQGFKPGEEFVLAVQEGQKIGAAIILGDQDVELTLRRLVQALAETDINKLMDPNSDVNRSMQELLPTSPGGGPSAVSSDQTPTVSKDEFSGFIETMKTRENVRQIMGQLKEVAPQLVNVMLTERDTYMAAGLNTLNQFHSIVAVMGIAHVDGVERNLKNEGWKQVTPRCPKQ